MNITLRYLHYSRIAGSIVLIMTSCSTQSVEQNSIPPSNTENSLNTPSSAAENEHDYIDGVYSAVGMYGGLPSSITVTITLDHEVITAVKVTPHATNPTSLDLQQKFAEAVPQEVIGKRISEVKVGKLAGSSGTPDGFNDAIRQIKQKAASDE